MKYIDLNKFFKITRKKTLKNTHGVELSTLFPVALRLLVYKNEKTDEVNVCSKFSNQKLLAYIVSAIYYKSKRTLPKKVKVFNPENKQNFILKPDVFYNWNEVINRLVSMLYSNIGVKK